MDDDDEAMLCTFLSFLTLIHNRSLFIFGWHSPNGADEVVESILKHPLNFD